MADAHPYDVNVSSSRSPQGPAQVVTIFAYFLSGSNVISRYDSFGFSF